jgi:hypothetical protein
MSPPTAPGVLLDLFPRSRSLLRRVGEAVIEKFTVPVRHWNKLGRLCQTRPDILDELKPLGGGS